MFKTFTQPLAFQFSPSHKVMSREVTSRKNALGVAVLACTIFMSPLLVANAAEADNAPASSGAAATNSDASPDNLIRGIAEDVLSSIKNDQRMQAGDPARVMALVDQKIAPHVDFNRMTQLAAGRYWAQANAEQRQALVREFRITLVRTYGGAVSAVKDQTSVQLRPSRQQTAENDAVVRTLINQPRGEPVQIDYRLQKTASGWKIYDVNILGVWLVDNYRNQFSQQIGQGGIDGLIHTLQTRNRSFESPADKQARTSAPAASTTQQAAATPSHDVKP